MYTLNSVLHSLISIPVPVSRMYLCCKFCNPIPKEKDILATSSLHDCMLFDTIILSSLRSIHIINGLSREAKLCLIAFSTRSCMLIGNIYSLLFIGKLAIRNTTDSPNRTCKSQYNFLQKVLLLTTGRDPCQLSSIHVCTHLQDEA